MNSSLRILYFHQHFSTPEGSAGIRSYMMARALIAAGHEVTIACGSYGVAKTGINNPFSRGKRKGNVDGIEVVEFNIPYSNRDGFIKRTIAFFRYLLESIFFALSFKYDLVIATSTPLTAGLIGSIIRWLTFRPFVFEVRDLWPELPKAMGVIRNPIILKVLSLIEWVSYRSAHKIIALAPGIADSISRKGIQPSKISLIPNGCDMTLFAPELNVSWRPEGVEHEDFLGVYAGTLGVANGVDAILTVAGELITRGRLDIKILLIGDGKLKEMLRSKVKSKDLQNIIFHEPVGKESLAGLFKSANVGFQLLENIPAFYYGTSPNKFFDYISAGLPVVTNYPGWVAELITEYNAGVVLGPDDPIEFANCLIELSGDDEGLQVKGANAKRLAQKRFDRVDLARNFVDVVESAHNEVKL